MPASAYLAEPVRGLPATCRLAGAVVACALLLQALLALPLAVRMAAEAMQWRDLGATVCTHSDDGTQAGDPRPGGQPPVHDHTQCQICQGVVLPFGLLVAALGLLAVLFAPSLGAAPVAAGPSRRRNRYGSYLSRAPPALA